MAKAKIIVEDKNDKHTYQAIINHIKLQGDLSVSEVEIGWEVSSAENNPKKPTGLIRTLKSLLNDIRSGSIERIGIVWDIDAYAEQKLKTVSTAVSEAFGADVIVNLFSKPNEFGSVVFDSGTPEEIEVKVACYFVGVNGKGEIEDLLKAIKSQPSPLADCIDEHLPQCLKSHGITDVNDKELVKLWINNYQRYDHLTKKDRSATNTAWENVMLKRGEQLFDFGKDAVPELIQLKDFLKMMTED
jgi:hypothetical protein